MTSTPYDRRRGDPLIQQDSPEEHQESYEGRGPSIGRDLNLEVDDASVVAKFAVGAPGVGPVMGFDSDDFYPSAPDTDLSGTLTDAAEAAGAQGSATGAAPNE